MTLKSSAQPEAPLILRHAMQTHVGLLRGHNEDCVSALPDAAIFIVADGMGGHAAGRVASEICVRRVGEAFARGESGASPMEVEASGARSAELSAESVELARALLLANEAIFEAANADLSQRGMGTTAVALRFFGDRVALSHAGDSRAYLCRGGELVQVTTDHSLSNFLYELGRSQEARIAEANMSNVIMRALGLEPHVDIDTRELVTKPGDIFLLCSDGLSDLVAIEELESIVTDSARSLADRVEILVGRALEEGGRDNISVVLVEVLEEGAFDSASIEEGGDSLCTVPPASTCEGTEDPATGTGPMPLLAGGETHPISHEVDPAIRETPAPYEETLASLGDDEAAKKAHPTLPADDASLWDGSPSHDSASDTVPVSGRDPDRPRGQGSASETVPLSGRGLDTED